MLSDSYRATSYLDFLSWSSVPCRKVSGIKNYIIDIRPFFFFFAKFSVSELKTQVEKVGETDWQYLHQKKSSDCDLKIFFSYQQLLTYSKRHSINFLFLFLGINSKLFL